MSVALFLRFQLEQEEPVVFGGFASHELAIRINDAKPKLLLTASCGIEIGKIIPYQPLHETGRISHMARYVLIKVKSSGLRRTSRSSAHALPSIEVSDFARSIIYIAH